MPFETFTRQRRRGRQPYVTIQKKGVFSLNKAAFDELGSPDSVELLYDRDARLVALRKVDSGVEHAYQLRTPVEGHATWLLSGAAFVSYYEIDTSRSIRRAARKEGDMLIVDLNDPGVAPRSEHEDSSEDSDLAESSEDSDLAESSEDSDLAESSENSDVAGSSEDSSDHLDPPESRNPLGASDPWSRSDPPGP